MTLQKIDADIATTLKFIHEIEEMDSLTEDIFLIRSFVAGWFHNMTVEQLLDELSPGQELELFREADNKYDKKAIVIRNKGKKMGYVPRRDNKILANLMDGGKLLVCKVNNIYEGDYDTLDIVVDIYLRD